MEANEFREILQGVEGRFSERLNEVENRLREYIDERTHDAETRIVRAFGAY